MTVLRKRLIQRPKPVVASSSGSTGAGMMSSLRGRGRGRGRGWVRGRGRGRGLVSQTRATAEEEVAEPAAVGRGRARGRGTVGRGRGTRGRGIGRGRVAMATGPGSSPASRPGSRLKIIRGLKGRGKAVIAIKRRLSTGSLQQMATPTRGRGMSRGRGRGRGSLSAGSTPVAGPSGATPLRVSIVEEQKVKIEASSHNVYCCCFQLQLEPVGVNLSPDFAATHHVCIVTNVQSFCFTLSLSLSLSLSLALSQTKKSLNTRFSQSQRSHVQRLVMTDGRNVQYS